jgi:glycine/D-amino acid oxidase-like deaminating enzyme
MKMLVIGGGIGGLATALSLHRAGIDVDIYEQAQELRELGVGINVLPHGIKELAALGLLHALDEAGIRTRELVYANRRGHDLSPYSRNVGLAEEASACWLDDDCIVVGASGEPEDPEELRECGNEARLRPRGLAVYDLSSGQCLRTFQLPGQPGTIPAHRSAPRAFALPPSKAD